MFAEDGEERRLREVGIDEARCHGDRHARSLDRDRHGVHHAEPLELEEGSSRGYAEEQPFLLPRGARPGRQDNGAYVTPPGACPLGEALERWVRARARRRGNEPAAPGRGNQKAPLDERCESLADRDPADTEPLAQGALGCEALAGPEAPSRYVICDENDDALVQMRLVGCVRAALSGD